jgi:hypothetical protein
MAEKPSLKGKLVGDFNKASGVKGQGSRVGVKTQKGKAGGTKALAGNNMQSAGHQPLGEKAKELIGRGMISGKAAAKNFKKRKQPNTPGKADTFGGEEQTPGGAEY